MPVADAELKKVGCVVGFVIKANLAGFLKNLAKK